MIRHKIDTAYTLLVAMVDETDNEAEEPSLTLSVTAANMDDTSMQSVTPDSTTNLGNGFYRLVLPATLLDVAGPVAIRVAASGANVFRTWVQVYDPDDNDVDEATLSAATMAAIADVTLRRNFDNVEASSDGDTLDKQSLIGAAAKDVNKVTLSGSTLTVTKADLETEFYTQPVTTDPDAQNVTSIG